MVTSFSVPAVPALVSNLPEPLMPPVIESFDSVSRPPLLMVNTPACVTLPSDRLMISTATRAVRPMAP